MLHRHGAGQAHLQPLLLQAQLAHGIANRLYRQFGRQQALEVENRAEFDEAARAGQFAGTATADQRLPAQRRIRAFRAAGDTGGDAVEGRRQVEVGAFRRVQRPAQQREQTSETRVLIERAKERLGGRDVIGKLLQLVGFQKHQPVAPEIRFGLDREHFGEHVGARAQLFDQCRLGRVHHFRDSALDHHHQGVAELRKLAVHLDFGLPPRQFRRQQVLHVGVDAQMLRGIRRKRCTDHQGRDHHQDCTALGSIDQRRKQTTHPPETSGNRELEGLARVGVCA